MEPTLIRVRLRSEADEIALIILARTLAEMEGLKMIVAGPASPWPLRLNQSFDLLTHADFLRPKMLRGARRVWIVADNENPGKKETPIYEPSLASSNLELLRAANFNWPINASAWQEGAMPHQNIFGSEDFSNQGKPTPQAMEDPWLCYLRGKLVASRLVLPNSLYSPLERLLDRERWPSG